MITIDYKTYEDFNIKRGARKYLPKLSNKYNFYLITSRDRDLEYKNVKHIIKRVEGSLNIQFRSICLTSGRLKGYFAKIFNCRYIIDDSLYKIQDVYEFGIIPIHLGSEKFKCWRDIYDYLSIL